MSTQAWTLVICHLPLVLWLVMDQFRTANRWADGLETHFPSWFQWNNSGDKVSWVHHGLIAFGVSLYGGLLSFLVPESFVFGAALLGWCAFAAYVVRELWGATWGAPNTWTHPRAQRVGWAVDGMMDTLGPLLVALAWARAWGVSRG